MKNKNNNANKLSEEYALKKNLYHNFVVNIKEIVTLLLENENIRFVSVAWREKDVEKLKEKIERKKKKGIIYKKLSDISDLAGVRIILFFEDDINQVVKMLDREFNVVKKENYNIEKYQLKPPDRFGYYSSHVDVMLNKRREMLEEYKCYKNLKCEIQIRTILQHAWAEIEHDIGYKPRIYEENKKAVEIRRMLSQNSALLEVADNNFVEIRKKFHEYIKKK